MTREELLNRDLNPGCRTESERSEGLWFLPGEAQKMTKKLFQEKLGKEVPREAELTARNPQEATRSEARETKGQGAVAGTGTGQICHKKDLR